jgi:hypothetical protein
VRRLRSRSCARGADSLHSGQNGYQIILPQELLVSSANVSVTINEVYTHVSQPKPKELVQFGEKQLMVWMGDLLGGFGYGRDIPDVRVRIKCAPNLAPTP